MCFAIGLLLLDKYAGVVSLIGLPGTAMRERSILRTVLRRIGPEAEEKSQLSEYYSTICMIYNVVAILRY